MLVEAHYTVYYEPLSEKEENAFKITNTTVDVVYGQLTPKSCDANIKLSRKTSWTFKRLEVSRKQSGGPGYIKGQKILTGDI